MLAGPQTLELRTTAGDEMAGTSTLQVPESVLAKQAVHAADYCLVGKPPCGALYVYVCFTIPPTPRVSFVMRALLAAIVVRSNLACLSI